jgi:hypothetical protein
VDEGWIAGQTAETPAAESRVVEHAGAGLKHGLPRSRQVVGHTQARFDLRRQRLPESPRHAFTRIHDAVVRIAGTRDVGTDEDGVLCLTRGRIEGHPRPADNGGNIEPRCTGGIIACRIEVRDLIVDPHVWRVPQEAGSVAERQPRVREEWVLNVELRRRPLR